MKNPCEDCLVLGACIGKITNGKYPDTMNIYTIIIRELCSICPELYRYLTPYDYYDYSLENRKDIVQFFLKRVKNDNSKIM